MTEQRNDGVPVTYEEALSIHIHDLIDVYEDESGDDCLFNLVVHLDNGLYHSLPYCDHSIGAIVLLNDLFQPPRPLLVSLRHVVQVEIDPDCQSCYARPIVAETAHQQEEE